MRPLLAGLLVLSGLIFAACGDNPPTQTPVVIVVTATPLPATPIPPTVVPPSATSVPTTNTPDAGAMTVATAAAQAQATQTQVADLAARATVDAEIQATRTAEAQPTPTPQPLPGIGDTIELAQWKISVAKVSGPKSELDWSGYGNLILADYQWWLVYVDARNQADTARNLTETIGWVLIDDKDNRYQDLTQNPYDSYEANEFANNAGRDQLGVGAKPGALTHPVLIFDVRGTPAQLQIHAPGEYDVLFSLKAKKK